MSRIADALKAKYGENYFSELGKRGGAKGSEGKGFASKKVGADGLTGAERAKLAGAKSRKIKVTKIDHEEEIEVKFE